MIDDPHLGDIYIDPQGKLWRCVVRVYEPTVTFEEVEGRTLSQGDCYRVLGGGQGQLGLQSQNQFVTGSQPQYYPSMRKRRWKERAKLLERSVQAWRGRCLQLEQLYDNAKAQIKLYQDIAAASEARSNEDRPQ